MATTEERLVRLEGKILPFQTMKKELYEDYQSLSARLGETEGDLRKARMEEVNAHRVLKDAREKYGHEEAAFLATSDIGGKNVEERKVNTAAAIAKAKSKDGSLHDLWRDVQQKEYEYETAVADKEICIDRFSAVRYVARMAAALANALGG